MAVIQKTDFTGGFYITATVNPDNLNKNEAADITVSNNSVRSGDLVLPIPPATLEGEMCVHGCHTVANGSFKVRVTNHEGTNAKNANSATWTFLVLRF